MVELQTEWDEEAPKRIKLCENNEQGTPLKRTELNEIPACEILLTSTPM